MRSQWIDTKEQVKDDHTWLTHDSAPSRLTQGSPSVLCNLAQAPIVAIGIGIPDLGLFVVKLLAIVGGVAVGALGCGWFVKLAVRVVTGQKVPQRIVTGFRALGGVTLGFLIWTWVFSAGGEGGIGGSGGGWWPFGQSGGKGAVVQKPGPETSVEPKKEPEPPPEKTDVLAIQLLGGARVKEQRFYTLDREPPRNLPELQRAVEERKQKQPALGRLDILIYSDSVDRDNPAVTELARWAREQGFQTRLITMSDQKAP